MPSPCNCCQELMSKGEHVHVLAMLAEDGTEYLSLILKAHDKRRVFLREVCVSGTDIKSVSHCSPVSAFCPSIKMQSMQSNLVREVLLCI